MPSIPRYDIFFVLAFFRILGLFVLFIVLFFCDQDFSKSYTLFQVIHFFYSFQAFFIEFWPSVLPGHYQKAKRSKGWPFKIVKTWPKVFTWKLKICLLLFHPSASPMPPEHFTVSHYFIPNGFCHEKMVKSIRSSIGSDHKTSNLFIKSDHNVFGKLKVYCAAVF